MRVRDHIALSTAGAALLYPLVGRRVLGVWAASILIDADHYIWFCLRRRSVNPIEAYRFFNRANPPHDHATKFLHSPAAISLALVLGARNRRFLSAAIGMSVHAALDALHESRLAEPRAVALERDLFTCQSCGAQGPDVVAHLDRQPALMPSYRLDDFIALCPDCHEVKHARGSYSVARITHGVPSLLTWLWKGL